MDHSAGLVFAKGLGYKAGAMMRTYDSPTIDTETKSDDSPVTVADKAINQMVIDRVAEVYPEHGVLGEEASNYTDQPYVWVCDPIDGTVAFINHIPTSVFSIALVLDGLPVIAVVYNPWTDELYSAVSGQGAFCNDAQIYVSKKVLKGSTIGVTGNLSIKHGSNKNTHFIEELKGNSYIVNMISSVFEGCIIAAGFIEGHVYYGKGAHDIAAIKLLVEEAGGKCTDLKGNEQQYNKPINGAVLSNGVIHAELLKLL